MPVFSLTPRQRELAERCRRHGYCWQDVVVWLGVVADPKKVGEIWSLYARDGSAIN